MNVVARPIPELPGVEHRFVDIAGLRVHVAEAGAGDPVVMLHGWPQNWFAYRLLIPAMAEHYRVICPDMRGFGWTEATPGGYRKRELAADVVALLDTLGLERVRLVGNDWGSIVGFIACLDRPERFERFLALGGAHLWPRVDPKAAWAFRHFWYQLVVATPSIGERCVASPAFLRRLYRIWSAKDVWGEAELDALLGQFSEPARQRASSLMYRHWLTRELPSVSAGSYRSRRLQPPTLFLHGTADGCIDPVYTRAPARQANLTVELLPGVGHFVAEEAAELVARRALEWFG